MKVKVTVNRTRFVKDQILDLPKKEAEGLIQRGLAVAVDNKPKARPEK